MPKLAGTLLALASMMANEASAQSATFKISPGSDVRVEWCELGTGASRCLRSTGRLLSYQHGVAALRSSSGLVDSVRLDRFATVSVRDGRRNHLVAGALIGLLLGAGAGAVAAEDCGGFSYETCGLAVPALAGVGLGVGAITGLLLRSDRWVPVIPSW